MRTANLLATLLTFSTALTMSIPTARAERLSVHTMSDAQKKEMGIPTKDEIESLKNSMQLWVYYYDILATHYEAGMPVRQLTIPQTDVFAEQACQFLKANQTLQDEDILALAVANGSPAFQYTSTVNRDITIPLTAGVYYKCAEYADVVHQWAFSK